jgi:hypothetical protein
VIARKTLSRVDLDVRPATPADAAGIAGLFDRVYRGGYFFAECTDPILLGKTLTGSDYIWMVVVDDDLVVGSIASRRDPGMGRYEIGRAAVHPDYRGRSDIVAAYDAVLRGTMRQPDSDLIYAEVRSELARRTFVPEATPFAWTSANGGMYRLNGEREEHLYGAAFNPERTVIRFVPPRSVVLPGSPVAGEIARLRATAIIGDYPAQICAGGDGEQRYESGNGRVSYAMFESSQAAVVTDVHGDSPADIRQALWDLLDGAAPSKIDHLTMYALADKLPVIAELCAGGQDDPGRRFRLSGYRPGWHSDGGARYDCVTLTARTDEQIPNRFGLGRRIEDVYRSFWPWT